MAAAAAAASDDDAGDHDGAVYLGSVKALTSRRHPGSGRIRPLRTSRRVLLTRIQFLYELYWEARGNCQLLKAGLPTYSWGNFSKAVKRTRSGVISQASLSSY